MDRLCVRTLDSMESIGGIGIRKIRGRLYELYLGTEADYQKAAGRAQSRRPRMPAAKSTPGALNDSSSTKTPETA